MPRGTRGSARGGASKRRYCLVNLRFTSGWPPSKHHYADRSSCFAESEPEILIAILPRREPIAFRLSPCVGRETHTWASPISPLAFRSRSLSENLEKPKTRVCETRQVNSGNLNFSRTLKFCSTTMFTALFLILNKSDACEIDFFNETYFGETKQNF